MRFLCLHGMGTSSKIFKMQTVLFNFLCGYTVAAFRYELADQHTYEFIQGTVPWPLAPELESLADASQTQYAYFDTGIPDSVVTALDDLETYIETQGPFDGVMAYSHGAALAGMLLARRQFYKPTEEPLFRCAIFFSPTHVYDPRAYLVRREVIPLKAQGINVFCIPIAIIYGEADEGKGECIAVQRLCDPSLVSVHVHQGGHEVPGLGVKGSAIRETVKMVRRGIIRAQFKV